LTTVAAPGNIRIYTPWGYNADRERKMLPKVKEDATARINRVVGQANGIKKMIEEDRYCVDILNQIAAVRSALDQLGVNLLTGHLESCVLSQDACRHGDLLEEVRTALSRFLK
jgi:DNA-binding FrmR family transcriptional regulator